MCEKYFGVWKRDMGGDIINRLDRTEKQMSQMHKCEDDMWSSGGKDMRRAWVRKGRCTGSWEVEEIVVGN